MGIAVSCDPPATLGDFRKVLIPGSVFASPNPRFEIIFSYLVGQRKSNKAGMCASAVDSIFSFYFFFSTRWKEKPSKMRM